MSNISLTTENQVATLTFDRENSGANIFDHATLEELSNHLDTIAADSSLTGLLITSAKPSIFIAGADLKSLASANPDELEKLIAYGQETFQKLADLKIITVAAIHGACLGGGLELALACDWHVASDSSKTSIGFPETQLGILPAWGGSTRLPRLVGLPTALSLILPGKILKPVPALKLGVVDGLAPRERVLSYAHTFLKKGKRPPQAHHLSNNPLSRKIIAAKARKDLLAKTRGLYPAPERTLEVVSRAPGVSQTESLANERQAVADLAVTPEARQLIKLFFLSEKAKKRRPDSVATNAQKPAAIENVAVIGAGVMGSGIAYWLASRGHRVVLQDINHDALARGLQNIEREIAAARKRHIFSTAQAQHVRDLILPALPDVPLHHCDLVIEAAVEKLSIKQQIFEDLSRRTRPDTLLATNTSALPIHELSSHIEHPERLLGLHFFNPVSRMKLVEVIHTPDTSAGTLDRAFALAQSIGKLPVPAKDSPGFIVNRLLLPYLLHATELFLQGNSPTELDESMLNFGMPMGPLRLLDEVGLDVAQHVAKTLSDAFPDRVRLPNVLGELVAQGHLGRKSGSGFYLYRNGKQANPNSAALQFQKQGNALPIDQIATTLNGLIVSEARMCLEEHVAANTDDLNLAMILGTGYPPFRGGPLPQNELD